MPHGLATLVLAMSVAPAFAGWPDISDAERRLEEVPGHPGAAAVVLLHQGRLELSGKSLSSYLDVYRRVKVLTEEGKSHGTVSLASSDFYRMKDLEARVHLPDGTVVPLPKDATFEKEYSGRYDRTIVSFALPQVGPGAIVEYGYRVYFDSVLYPEPWFFQDVIPTLRSEIVCSIPKNYQFKPHAVRTIGKPLEEDVKGSARGTTASYALSDVPPVPDEPGTPPFQDLATRITFLPLMTGDGSGRVPLLASWGSVVKIFQGDRTYGYELARKHAMTAGSRGKKLAEAAPSPVEGAAAIYRFIRDEIALQPMGGLGNQETQGDEILSAGKGGPVQKALLLQIMLDGAGIGSSLGWTRHRETGRVDKEMVNPGQFDAVLVVADVGGRRVFMDPTDRGLPFGALPPGLEDVPCLLLDRPSPEWVLTPITPWSESARKASLDLAVGADGALSGKGRIVLTGHHAWERVGWGGTREKSVDAWTRWLGGKLEGYDVKDVAVVEKPEEREVTVDFAVSQRREEALGNEASVGAALLMRQKDNPFTLAPEKRMAPVRIPFRDSDQLEILVTYPAGWRVASRPSLRTLETSVGSLAAGVLVDEAARSVRMTRRLDTVQTDVARTAYPDLKSLFEAVVANDAETLVLARR